jgi:di- and tripeptidase
MIWSLMFRQIYSGQPDLHSGVEGGAVVEPMLDM